MSLVGLIPIPRDAVRAILLTPEQEVLLMRISEPGTSGGFWITPGGGVEPGENIETALRRELLEELGLEDFEIGGEVWRRQHTFNWLGKRFCQRERYFMVRVPRFTPHMSDPIEAKVFQEFRWWPLLELQQTALRLTPLALAKIVGETIARDAPTQPDGWEVVED